MVEDFIVVQGDCLEEGFVEEFGQWQGIIIGWGFKGNMMSYIMVKNFIFGVYVDFVGQLIVCNFCFYNINSSGIIGFYSCIDFENCLVYNNFVNFVQLVNGGDYNFDYCMVVSYGVDVFVMFLFNFFCYDSFFICQVWNDYCIWANFCNCIFFGISWDEL